MRRFYVDEIKEDQRTLSITGPEAKHIGRVLRMGPGDRLILMDRKGRRFQAVVEKTAAWEVRVLVEKILPAPSSPPVDIRLCQSLLKSNAMDYMVQKTSELGVSAILPFISERTVVKTAADAAGQKLERWRKISQSAAKQSNKDRPAEIEPLTSFDRLVKALQREKGLKVVLWEAEDATDLKSVLRSSPVADRLIAVIGPEGGFGREEVSAAREAGLVSVSLGSRILRAETAAIALAAVVQYEWGDLSIRDPNRPALDKGA